MGINELSAKSELFLALFIMAVFALTLREMVPLVVKKLTNGKDQASKPSGVNGIEALEARVASHDQAIVELRKDLRTHTSELTSLQRDVATREDFKAISSQLLSVQASMATRADIDTLRARYEDDVSSTMKKILDFFKTGGVRLRETPPEGNVKP